MRAVLYTESMGMTDGQPMIIRQARALSHVLDKMPIQILPSELLVNAAADPVPAAALYPEAHRNLLVRVAGHSAHFVDLAGDVQEDVIARFHRS